MYRAQSSVKLHVQIVVDLPQKDGNGLYLCVKDETQKYLSVSGQVVRDTAMLLYNHCGEYQGDEKCSFCANKGWFQNCKRQINLFSVVGIKKTAFLSMWLTLHNST